MTPRPEQDVPRILSEAEVFVKYGLYARAVDHLRRIFEHAPDHRAAREKLAAALAQLGRRAEAAAELATIAEGLRSAEPVAAAGVAERALALDPSCARAAALLGRAAAPAPTTADASAAQATPPPRAVPGDGVVGRRPPLRAIQAAGPPATSGARREAHGPDLDAELEQVDFFLEQELPDEARSLLDDLGRRFRDDGRASARIADKRRAVERLADGDPTGGGVPAALLDDQAGALPVDGGGVPHARDRDTAVGPVAVVAAGGDADLSTHGDLGIAYKEMGLNDAAIAEFKQLTEDPAREVFALTMIGECLEAKGTLTDAVIRYKEALNCPAVTPAETLVLYHLLGSVFERIGDRSEALYFFEKVAKRDPRFQDVDQRIAALRVPPPPRPPSQAGRGSG